MTGHEEREDLSTSTGEFEVNSITEVKIRVPREECQGGSDSELGVGLGEVEGLDR